MSAALYGLQSDERRSEASQPPTILIATLDSAICGELTGILSGFSVNTIWGRSLGFVKTLLRKERVSACLCGLWLQDGTFRDLVHHIRRASIDIPVIITAGPAPGVEYAKMLGAMNIGALGFLPHPYSKVDLERMLKLAIDVSPSGNFHVVPNTTA